MNLVTSTKTIGGMLFFKITDNLSNLHPLAQIDNYYFPNIDPGCPISRVELLSCCECSPKHGQPLEQVSACQQSQYGSLLPFPKLCSECCRQKILFSWYQHLQSELQLTWLQQRACRLAEDGWYGSEPIGFIQISQVGERFIWEQHAERARTIAGIQCLKADHTIEATL